MDSSENVADLKAKDNLEAPNYGDSTVSGTGILSEEENKRLRLKADLVVLPIMNGMAYAAVYGMKTDANLKGQKYSWLGSIFYFGYLGMEFPALWFLTKVPIGKYVGAMLFCWGACLCGMAGCNNFAGLAVVRFLLGVFEAGILPCFMVLTSVWYSRNEQPIRTALWYNTFAGIFGGILSYAIGHISGPLAAWKYIFLIYGTVTMLVGIITIFLLPDSPNKAWFYSKDERKLATMRTAHNQTGISTINTWKVAHVREVLRDPKYWCVAIYVVAQSITNAGITNFNPLIISGYGFSQTKTTLMATPQAAVAFVAQIIATSITFLVPNIRCLLWVLSCFPALAGSVMIHTLDINSNRTASLAGVYLMGFYNVSWVLVLSLQSSNNAGTTKKTFISVSVAVFYSIGNIVGPQFFRTSQSPHYPLGIFAMMSLCLFENKRRDRVYGLPDTNEVALGLQVEAEDRTDGENINFRYVY
uniref:Putative transporter n=1 Tax=Talaromyces marneffei PM1 TaxID=1077442 RepID=A0A093VJ93_TALMA